MKKVLLLSFLTFCSYCLFTQTTVNKTDGEWRLYVDGNSFEIKGATFGYTDDVSQYDSRFQDLKFLGVNTIRLWAWKMMTILTI